MSVFVFSLDHAIAPGAILKAAVAARVVKLELLKLHKPQPGDVTYVDLTGLDEDARKKALTTIRRRCAGEAWGVIDPDGTIADPAMVFFSGATDYLGPAACQVGIDKARLRAVLAFNNAHRSPLVDGDGIIQNSNSSCDEIQQAPFCGWKSIQPGTVYPFFFLYVSVSAQLNLKTRLGEAGYINFRDRLRNLCQQTFAEAEPLLWMETDASALYLIPPQVANVGVVTEACLRMLLGAPLLGYERLYLPFPITFSFALHSGSTEFAPPGKTGTIVSDAVNYIYHLGSKHAGPGRLTVSEEAARLAITHRFEDLFTPAGSFEGRAILHSRRFGV
jgi:hypothetical protein